MDPATQNLAALRAARNRCPVQAQGRISEAMLAALAHATDPALWQLAVNIALAMTDQKEGIHNATLSGLQQVR